MSKIKVIAKRADSKLYATSVSNRLENLQSFVGGYIEALTLFDEPRVVIICNEEGRINGMPYNCSFLGADWYGDLLIVGAEGEEFADCPLTLAEARRVFNLE